MPAKQSDVQSRFVEWFRQSSPYIRAFRGRIFVIAVGGEMLADKQFPELVHDLALLNNLGIRLVLVYGARPQIESRLKQHGAELRYAKGLRITDDLALECVKDAAGSVRVEIEALLSMGLSNSPMEKAEIRVVSGNFITAQPLGIREGVDYLHTGEVRSINSDVIHWHLDDQSIVLLGPLGYSPTGEIFNISAEEIATAAAVELGADKLIFLTDEKGILDSKKRVIRELNESDATKLLAGKRKISARTRQFLEIAIRSCQAGIPRIHLIDRHIDGAILLELFTRNGIGTLISAEDFEDTRTATIDDVGGILDLITPLEEDGNLVRRSRERLEIEINHFTIVERDGMVVACAALYPFPEEHVAELACLAVHPDYRNEGRGEKLFQYILRKCNNENINKLFVLTTRTAHWFRERGFKSADLKQLPVKRQAMYNYKRQAKVFIKCL